MYEVKIRKIEKNEIDKLEDMLYEAVYQPDKNNPIPRDVIKVPQVNAYINEFGKSTDDHCFVADLNGKIIGAVWVRIITGKIKGYGNIDNKTPEFVISLYKEYRNKGIGTKMMNKMINYLQKSGYKQTSLSVQKDNYAVKLYKKIGFEIIEENDGDYLMLLKLN
ncbi:MAG: GNAT family N-acetyltransferase [Marinilabiliaceae bacterium]|nr:GNAT family N-acetyltransferase [Marinilabiliaceae bacterium]